MEQNQNTRQVSEWFEKKFSISYNGKTPEEQIFEIGKFRISSISPQILRVETGNFCDMPTQTVVCRSFSNHNVKFSVNNNIVSISTANCVFAFDFKKGDVVSATLKGGKRITDFSGGNLKGTARTLDMINGSLPLGKGLMSTTGGTFFDDSKSCILNENGTISERPECTDRYFLAFGNDYRGCLKRFFKLCGEVPLIPRYCLGNWWSRYKAYTRDEYLTLMKRFIDEEIPITVATIDMDWHYVKRVETMTPERLGMKNSKNPFAHIGWTGYTWEDKLFPDYRAMLSRLRDEGFKVTLNLHPHRGVRPFEKQYKEFAEFMGIDPEKSERIPFDITDPKYIEAYFKLLHKPYEDEGVDFWWIDWQREKTTKVKGLDPLWALNHYHTLAFNGENKRPLILSRFGGLGSHRFPLGFSGDTIISWKSLDFRPYFTNNAANVGYTWWSHDIGGHRLGRRNDEIYARWVRLGAFSPINRLHSTRDEFMGKEPWMYSFAAKASATNMLKLRHALIPYIYTANNETHTEGIPLCEPIYYRYPNKKDAYEIRNEYFFGSELLVCPVTSPINKFTNLAKTKVWFPKGRWTNIFTGRIFEGERFETVFSDLDSMPVFAKEGAIVPMSQNDKTNDWKNPSDMKIRIWRGNNTYTLYEDDGETFDFEKGKFAKTVFEVSETPTNLRFVINKVDGDKTATVEKRNYVLSFEDIVSSKSINVLKNGKKVDCEISEKLSKTEVVVENVTPDDVVEIVLDGKVARTNPDQRELNIERISRLQMGTVLKRTLFKDKI